MKESKYQCIVVKGAIKEEILASSLNCDISAQPSISTTVSSAFTQLKSSAFELIYVERVALKKNIFTQSASPSGEV